MKIQKKWEVKFGIVLGLLLSYGLIVIYSVSGLSWAALEAYLLTVAVVFSIFFFWQQKSNWHISETNAENLFIVNIIIMLLFNSDVGFEITRWLRWFGFENTNSMPAILWIFAVIIYLGVYIEKSDKRSKLVVVIPAISLLVLEFLVPHSTIHKISLVTIAIGLNVLYGKNMIKKILASSFFSVWGVVLIWQNWHGAFQVSSDGILRKWEAINAGGLFGKGIGNATYQVDIYSLYTDPTVVVIEEFGILGLLLAVILFLALLAGIFYVFRVAYNMQNKLAMTLSMAVGLHFAVIVIVKICEIFFLDLNIVLPFFTYDQDYFSYAIYMLEIMAVLVAWKSCCEEEAKEE